MAYNLAVLILLNAFIWETLTQEISASYSITASSLDFETTVSDYAASTTTTTATTTTTTTEPLTGATSTSAQANSNASKLTKSSFAASLYVTSINVTSAHVKSIYVTSARMTSLRVTSAYVTLSNLTSSMPSFSKTNNTTVKGHHHSHDEGFQGKIFTYFVLSIMLLCALVLFTHFGLVVKHECMRRKMRKKP